MTNFNVFLCFLLFGILNTNIVEPRRFGGFKIPTGPRTSLKVPKPKISHPSAPTHTSNSHSNLHSIGHATESKSSSAAIIGSERASASKPVSIENSPTPVHNSFQKNPNIGFREDIVHGTSNVNSAVNSKPPPIGFKKDVVQPIGTHNIPSTSYPSYPTHVSHPNTYYPSPYPNVPHSSVSQPDTSRAAAPYPGILHPYVPRLNVSSTASHLQPHINTPYPVNHPISQTSPIGVQNNAHNRFHQPSYPSYPTQPISSVPYGSSTYPAANYNPLLAPVYSPHPPSMTGTPFQSPHVLAQPATQPFVPGHTVIMVPGQQQDSSRGLGQIFKEALVFSAVNAGVNRIINPPHHHVYESGSTGTAGTAPPSVTHITYNNQYINNFPANNDTAMTTNGQMPPLSPPQAPAPIGIPAGNMGTSSIPNGNVMNQPSSLSTPSNMPRSESSNTLTATMAQNTLNNNINQNSSFNDQQNNNNYLAQYVITDDELYKISEELFTQEEYDISNYLRINLQARSLLNDTTDVATHSLFEALPEVYDIPSIRMIRNLYDNYEHNSLVKERKTTEEEKEENIFLDVLLNSNVINTAMRWLSNRNFIEPDDFERKDTLRQIWFSQFNGVTSGFERVFLSELYGNKDILGVQNWIYFSYLESRNRINYLGYVDKLDLGNRASLIKLNFELDGIRKQNATIFVGITPELEMSLYVICFYTRPNNLCPVSLGGSKFTIFTHTFRYFGKDLIDLAVPIF